MNANEILKKHEDANEMHFHEVDRKWIIEAMEEYAALCQPPVSGNAERDMWKLLDKINVIMWESYMIKDYPFGRNEGRKIMEMLEQWAERH